MCTYNVGSVSLDGENNSRANCGANDGANGPKECQAVQHDTERLASLVAEVQPLAEFGATRAVDGANVLDVGVDARTKRRALGQ